MSAANNYQILSNRTLAPTDHALTKYNEGSITLNGGVIDGPSLIVLEHAVKGISGEAGELSGAMEKCINYNQPLDTVNIKEELGDLLWYIAQACTTLGVKIEDVMQANINKLAARYPDKFDCNKALEENRDRATERAIVDDSNLTAQRSVIDIDLDALNNTAIDADEGNLFAVDRMKFFADSVGVIYTPFNNWSEVAFAIRQKVTAEVMALAESKETDDGVSYEK